MSTIASHSPLNISETVTDRGLITKDQITTMRKLWYSYESWIDLNLYICTEKNYLIHDSRYILPTLNQHNTR